MPAGSVTTNAAAAETDSCHHRSAMLLSHRRLPQPGGGKISATSCSSVNVAFVRTAVEVISHCFIHCETGCAYSTCEDYNGSFTADIGCYPLGGQ